MNYLDEWRASQREHIRFPADEQLTAYLAESDPANVVCDYAPHTAVEIRHIGYVRGNS